MAIVLWGFSFIWTQKLLISDIPVFTLIAIRMILSGTLLFIFSKLTGKLEKVRKEDWKWMALLAFSEPFVYFIGETFGLKSTESPTLCALIVATIPVFVMFSETIFYKAKFAKRNIFGVFLTIPGIFLMVMQSGDFSTKYWWGIAFLFLAVCGSVGYSTFARKLGDKYNAYTISTYQFLIGFLFFAPFSLATNDGYDLKNFLNPEILRPLVALAVLCSCVAFVCYMASIKEIGMTKTSVFTALIPAVSAVGSWMYGYEQLTFIQIVGVAVVVCGVIITQMKKTNKIKSK